MQRQMNEQTNSNYVNNIAGMRTYSRRMRLSYLTLCIRLALENN